MHYIFAVLEKTGLEKGCILGKLTLISWYLPRSFSTLIAANCCQHVFNNSEVLAIYIYFFQHIHYLVASCCVKGLMIFYNISNRSVLISAATAFLYILCYFCLSVPQNQTVLQFLVLFFSQLCRAGS